MWMRRVLMLTEIRKIFGAGSQNMTLCDGGLLCGNRSSGVIQIVYHSVCTVSWIKTNKIIEDKLIQESNRLRERTCYLVLSLLLFYRFQSQPEAKWLEPNG